MTHPSPPFVSLIATYWGDDSAPARRRLYKRGSSSPPSPPLLRSWSSLRLRPHHLLLLGLEVGFGLVAAFAELLERGRIDEREVAALFLLDQAFGDPSSQLLVDALARHAHQIA